MTSTPHMSTPSARDGALEAIKHAICENMGGTWDGFEPATRFVVIQEAAVIFNALVSHGYRLAGPDQAVVELDDLDRVSTTLYETIMNGGDWKAGCRKARQELFDMLAADKPRTEDGR